MSEHPKLKFFRFRPHYYYRLSATLSKKRFELEREKDRERTNRTSFRSISPPRLPPICLARCLYSHSFDFGEEKQTFYINKRENWNKKREEDVERREKNERRKRRLLRGEFFFKTQKRAHAYTNKKRREERIMRDFSARASTSFAEGAFHRFNASRKRKTKGAQKLEFSLFFLGPRDDFAPSAPTQAFFFIVLRRETSPFLNTRFFFL